jgi:pimeloyl-ACP methyl ester carboxylesterase
LALKNLDSYVTTEGPFDGVIGFSQGAGLAAMYLIRRLIEDPECESPFKCAILMSRIGVYDEKKWVESGKLSLLESLPPHRKKIDIPTVAIWGQTDEYSRKESELTESFFGPHRVWSYVHRGGHDVPGPHIPGSVSQTIKLINRAVTSVRLDEQEKKLHNI